jgi:hypothetical protein
MFKCEKDLHRYLWKYLRMAEMHITAYKEFACFVEKFMAKFTQIETTRLLNIQKIFLDYIERHADVYGIK